MASSHLSPSSPLRPLCSFFHNKGAVAGVFTVVGLIALIIFFILGTTFIRKRRARKFDKEIDEAAAEAAAASRGPDFDDYDYNPAHAASGGYTGYSDGSHGTFAQPPMSIGHASDYRMPDVPPNFDPAFGVGASGTAGAAGIGAGVGTAAMQRARSRRDGQPQVPYNAFGAAPQEQYEMQDSRLRYRGNTTGPDYDLLDAAALTGTAGDPYAVARGPSTRTGTTQYSNSGSGSGSGGALSRNQSQNAREMLSPSVEEDYPLTTAFAGTSDGHGAPAYYSPQVQPDSYATYNGAEGAVQHVPEPQHDVDPYGGYIDASPSPGMPIPNPHSPFAEMSPAHQQTASPDDTDDEDDHMPSAHDAHSAGQHVLGDSRASLGDQEDYGYESERRVLRVRVLSFTPRSVRATDHVRRRCRSRTSDVRSRARSCLYPVRRDARRTV